MYPLGILRALPEAGRALTPPGELDLRSSPIDEGFMDQNTTSPPSQRSELRHFVREVDGDIQYTQYRYRSSTTQ